MVDAPERIWMTAEEMGWPGSFRSFRMSDLEHPEDEYPAYVRADLYEQVGRERDEANKDRDRWYRASFVATKKAESAERLAGARVKPLPDDDNKLAQMVEDFHKGSVAFANDPDEFQHLIEFTPPRLRSFISAIAEPAGEVHPDDLAVDRFAAAMKAKLARKRAEGRGGWENRDECSAEHLSYLLIQHCLKGDPLDVGNLAMSPLISARRSHGGEG